MTVAGRLSPGDKGAAGSVFRQVLPESARCYHTHRSCKPACRCACHFNPNGIMRCLTSSWLAQNPSQRLPASSCSSAFCAPSNAQARVQQHQPLACYDLLHFWAYVAYPPLYIAGPILTFNSFASQLQQPVRLSGRQVRARYHMVATGLRNTTHYDTLRCPQPRPPLVRPPLLSRYRTAILCLPSRILTLQVLRYAIPSPRCSFILAPTDPRP